ncbi:hypothetical protein CPLU01_12734 [Colletotrichum plurivorum]|uniref:Uncharacterized protein n=1 Tax=Colletotrichum plurivorum TaxID=2175906 RepID=A0A8H6N5V1_9PEZI|nr:hypothetical protein CPLU01_12734 [Colletotrichum plurivorum]
MPQTEGLDSDSNPPSGQFHRPEHGPPGSDERPPRAAAASAGVDLETGRLDLFYRSQTAHGAAGAGSAARGKGPSA